MYLAPCSWFIWSCDDFVCPVQPPDGCINVVNIGSDYVNYGPCVRYLYDTIKETTPPTILPVPLVFATPKIAKANANANAGLLTLDQAKMMLNAAKLELGSAKANITHAQAELAFAKSLPPIRTQAEVDADPKIAAAAKRQRIMARNSAKADEDFNNHMSVFNAAYQKQLLTQEHSTVAIAAYSNLISAYKTTISASSNLAAITVLLAKAYHN